METALVDISQGNGFFVELILVMPKLHLKKRVYKSVFDIFLCNSAVFQAGFVPFEFYLLIYCIILVN